LGNRSWFLGHTWSLAVEEQFYFIWPLALKLMDLKTSTLAAAALIAISPLLRVGTYLLAPNWEENSGMMLHTRADALMFGALTALLYGEPKFQEFIKACFHRKLHLIAVIFLFVVNPLLVIEWGGSYIQSFGWTAEGCSVALLLVWSLQNPSGVVGRVLNSTPVVHVGVLSYSLYLWQQLFLTDLNHTISGMFPINLGFAIVAAELSYHLVERPFLRLRARHFDKPKYANMVGSTTFFE
jgi:peptidoglycan/LPS O-acetylase OafA/YrhL